MNENKTSFDLLQSLNSRCIQQTHVHIVLAVLCIFLHSAFGQTHSISVFEKNAFINRQVMPKSEASIWFDVTYYKLDLEISSQPNYLKGEVNIVGICRQNNSQSLTLDLGNTLHVDSIHVNGKGSNFFQKSSSFDITLDRPLQFGEILSINIFYRGTPAASGFGSFVFNIHSGVPWVYSLSEPFGASDWWPCKNIPSDKADSADIIVTCDSMYKVGSQGTLVSVVNHGNGKSTYNWKERYPIAPYLISIAMSNYVQFSNWFRYTPTDSMEIINYVLPEHYENALQTLPKVIDMLSIYSNLYGLYPFIKEKYGHAEFGSGGMEHQTMTSLGTFEEDVIAHELAHQWFGDMITCQSWSDLWLNESFAQYSTALYRENKYGVSSYWNYINSQRQIGMTARGVIGSPDTSSPNRLFDSPLIYSKGASVLHMLRHVLGDSIFFHSMHAYANDSLLKYSTAITKNFQNVCENVSNTNLGYFFKEWIYGENIPNYEYSWDWKSSGDSAILTINIDQPIGRINPTYFTMPIDVRIRTAGRDTMVTIFNNAQAQTFKIRFPTQPASVLLDPEGWILKTVFSKSDYPPSDYLLKQNYPNPFNATTKIKYMIPKSVNVTLKIYDVLGREVTTLVDSKQTQGSYECQWSSQNFNSGVYFYRLNAGEIQLQKKMILLR
jgi:aminopeptidase N